MLFRSWHKNGVLNASMPNPYYDNATATTDGLVGYWPFNNDTLDYALGNDGTQNGGVNCGTGVAGKIGTACSFGGNQTQITAPNSQSLNITGSAITLSAWVYPRENNTYDSIIYKGSYGLKIGADRRAYFELVNSNISSIWADTGRLGTNTYVFSLATYNGF